MDFLSIIAIAYGLVLVGIIYKIVEISAEMKKIGSLYSDVSYMERKVANVKKDVDELVSNYGSLPKLSKRIKKIESSMVDLKGSILESEGKVKSTAEEVERLNNKLTELFTITTQLERKVGELEGNKEKIKEISKAINVIDEEVSRLSSKMNEVIEDNKKIESDVLAITDEVENMSLIVATYQDFRKELIERVDSLSFSLKDMELRLSKLESFLEFMKDVEKSVKDVKARIEAFESTRSAIYEMLSKSRSDIKKLTKLIRNLRAPVVYSMVKTLQSNVKEMARQLTTLDYELSVVRGKLWELSKKYEAMLTPSELDDAIFDEEISEAVDKVNKIKELLKKMK